MNFNPKPLSPSTSFGKLVLMISPEHTSISRVISFKCLNSVHSLLQHLYLIRILSRLSNPLLGVNNPDKVKDLWNLHDVKVDSWFLIHLTIEPQLTLLSNLIFFEKSFKSWHHPEEKRRKDAYGLVIFERVLFVNRRKLEAEVRKKQWQVRLVVRQL